MLQASMLHFTLEDSQWEEDWSTLLSLASQPGSSLEQLHIFALAHILRRPIIVYGVKYVKSFRGEDIGYARFEGELVAIYNYGIHTNMRLYARRLFTFILGTKLLHQISHCSGLHARSLQCSGANGAILSNRRTSR